LARGDSRQPFAHWREVAELSKGRIHRPRQIYVGQPLRNYVNISERVGTGA